MRIFNGKQYLLCDGSNEPTSLASSDEPVLIGYEKQLLETQSRLSEMDINEWRKHTDLLDECRVVLRCLKKRVKAEMPTRAWLKMFEMLRCFPTLTDPHPDHIGDFTSVHLCEAPGAFVCALAHFLLQQDGSAGKYNRWDWRAVSLNWWYEWNEPLRTLPVDGRLSNPRSPDHTWIFGKHWSGDIIDPENRNSIAQELKMQLGGRSIWLVTADGGMNCQNDPAQQELMSAPLIRAEIDLALSVLCAGGCLVLKTFNQTSRETLEMSIRLCSCFETVHLVKPTASKSGNSERYLVCIGFGEARTIDVSSALINSNAELMLWQIKCIQRSIENARPLTNGFCTLFSDQFLKYINLQSRKADWPSLLQPHGDRVASTFMSGRQYIMGGSLAERQQFSEKLQSLTTDDCRWLAELICDLCWPNKFPRLSFSTELNSEADPQIFKITKGLRLIGKDVKSSAFINQDVLPLMARLRDISCHAILHDCPVCSSDDLDAYQQLTDDKSTVQVRHLLCLRNVDCVRFALSQQPGSTSAVSVELACPQGCIRLKFEQDIKWAPDGVDQDVVCFLKQPPSRAVIEFARRCNHLWAWALANWMAVAKKAVGDDE